MHGGREEEKDRRTSNMTNTNTYYTNTKLEMTTFVLQIQMKIQ